MRTARELKCLALDISVMADHLSSTSSGVILLEKSGLNTDPDERIT